VIERATLLDGACELCNEGIDRVRFIESDKKRDMSYERRGGKYQGLSVLIVSEIRTIVSDIFSQR